MVGQHRKEPPRRIPPTFLGAVFAALYAAVLAVYVWAYLAL